MFSFLRFKNQSMQSELFYIRDLLDSDAKRLFEIYSNAEAMKYRENPPMKTLDDSYKMLEKAKEQKLNGYEFRFGIIEKSSETLIGTIMYQPIKNKAIIGYSIDEKFWNKGYASEVVKIILNELKTKKFIIIEAWVNKQNVASSKVLEKNGFKHISQTLYPENHFYQLIL